MELNGREVMEKKLRKVSSLFRRPSESGVSESCVD